MIRRKKGHHVDRETRKTFNQAGHPYYDGKAFDAPELEMARAFDKHPNLVWVRNRSRADYGIPLPIKSGTSSTFYPDFLWWVKDTIWAIDPTGTFILDEKARTKLLNLPAQLKIALVSRERLDQNLRPMVDSGWTLLRFRHANARPEPFDTIEEVLAALVSES